MMELKIDSMSCGGCAASVTKAVKQADPQAKVAVDLATKLVSIDTALDRATIVQSLNNAGYRPA